MASKKFKTTWVGVYRDDTNKYVNANIVRTGNSPGYNSYIGFNAAQLLEAIESSSTTPKVILHFNVTTAGTFDFGMHRDSYNRKANGLPYYRYAGKSFTPSKGWASYDITKFDITLSGYSGVDTFEEALRAGFQGIVLYGARGARGGVAHGYTNNSNHLYIEIQGTWNTKPGKPSITYPTSGEIINEKVTLRGTPASDSEQSETELRYQWQIYDGSWNILPMTNSGRIDYTLDFSQYKETSAAKVGLRAYDGELYGDWVYSPVFTINHNKPPAMPTNLTPRGGEKQDRTQDLTLRWKHNDQDNQSKFDLRWRAKGTETWKVISRNTVNEYAVFKADTFPMGEIEWQVKTYDQRGLESPFSTITIFYATEASDSPTILQPAQNETIPISRPDIHWSSVDQTYFNLEILSGDTEIWSVTEQSNVKSYTVGIDLSNNTDYRARLRILSDNGFWSAWEEVNFHTSFTPPVQPEPGILIDEENGVIEISVTNPPPEQLEPDVTHNELFRRDYAKQGELIKISDSIEPNSYYRDYAPASGVIYEYIARAWGANGTYSDSVPILAQVNFSDAFLSQVTNPNNRIKLRINPTRSINRKVNRVMRSFNGRAFPVAEFGQRNEAGIRVTYTVLDNADIDTLERLLNAREILLYRDMRGRREFVTIEEITITDRFPRGYNVDMSMDRVDYKEGLET